MGKRLKFFVEIELEMLPVKEFTERYDKNWKTIEIANEIMNHILRTLAFLSTHNYMGYEWNKLLDIKVKEGRTT